MAQPERISTPPVGAALNSRQQIGEVRVMRVALVCVAAAALVVTMSPHRMVAAPQSASAPNQTQSPRARSGFEVASVKLNASGSDRAYVQALPGRFVITNVALRRLILSAFDIQDYQISGDPPWIGSDHYDIQCKADGNASVQQMEGPMLQALLEDRFKLRLHRETRQLPIYELTVAKGGVKLERTKEGSCISYSMDSSPPPQAAPDESRPTYCGFPRLRVDGLHRTLEGAGVSIAGLATTLSRNYTSELRRNVIDRTGLTGTFDVHLKWTMDVSTGVAGPGTSDGAGTALPPADFADTSIFAA